MKLFQPIKIGGIEIKNRIVMAPITTHYANRGYVTSKMVDYYEKRAAGGVGLITVEDGIVDYPLGNNTYNPLSVDDDKYIPKLKKLSDTIKKYGCVSMLQLSHAGRRAGRLSPKTGRLDATGGKIPIAPSALAHPVPGHVVPIPMNRQEIGKVIEKFGRAAMRSVEAGFEMIGLHCAHMYLCGQFLSPWSNKRKDEYGGSITNRLRFVLCVIKEIRENVGNDIPIVCRINGQEPEGGNSVFELQKIALALEKAGVNSLHVSVGFGYVLWEKNFLPAEAPIGTAEGCIVSLSENIKKAVSIPVIAVNKIRHVGYAEDILIKNRADMIALGRPLLADPEWPNKAMKNKYKDIRPCVSCCQGCVGGMEKERPVTCLVNPALGKEKKMELNLKAVVKSNLKKILVIGAGPAGIQCAIVAALRGHKVTIWEKEEKLGGKMLMAAKTFRKSELSEFIDYLLHNVNKLGIKTVLNKNANSKTIVDFKPDVVIIATGSKSLQYSTEEKKKYNIESATRVFRDDSFVGENVIIIGGGAVGLETAEYLIEKGIKISVIEKLDDVGSGIPTIIKIPLEIGLKEKGVKIYKKTSLLEIMNDKVVIECEGNIKKIKSDTILFATGELPDLELSEDLQGTIPEKHVIGDAQRPGDMLSAICHGFKIGMQI